MSDPIRLHEDETHSLGALLVRAGRDYAPPDARLRRIAAGIASAGATIGGATFAAGSSAAAGAGVGLKISGTALLTVVKWIGIGALGGLTVSGTATVFQTREQPVPVAAPERETRPIEARRTSEIEREALARAFCTNLGDNGCIDRYESESGISEQAKGCSVADKISACTMDELFFYLNHIPANCDGAWRAALTCGTRAEYARDCHWPVSFDSNNGSGPNPGVCDAEGEALFRCRQENPAALQEVTGTQVWYGCAWRGDLLCGLRRTDRQG